MSQRRRSCGRDDVLERHVDDGERDQGLDQGREPECVRREAEGGRDQRDRVRDGERGDDQDEGAERRNGMTRHSRKSRWSVPSRMWRKPRRDEPKGGLMPPRIEPDEARIAGELEGAHRAPGGRNRRTVTTRSPSRPKPGRIENRDASATGSSYSSHTSSSPWLQESSVSSGERRARDVGQRPRRRSPKLRSEGSETRAATMRGGGEAGVVFVELDLVGDPQAAPRARSEASAPCEIQVAGPAGRIVARRAWRRAATRTSRCSRWPSGLRKACTVTSAGMSWAAAGDGSRRPARRQRREDGGASRSASQANGVAGDSRACRRDSAPVVYPRPYRLQRCDRNLAEGSGDAWRARRRHNLLDRRGVPRPSLVALGVGQAALERAAAAEAQSAVQAPDVRGGPVLAEAAAQPLAPRLGVGVTVDARDHVFIVHRGGSSLNEGTEIGAATHSADGGGVLPSRAAHPRVRSRRQPRRPLGRPRARATNGRPRTTGSPSTTRATSGSGATARRTPTS